MTYPLCLLIALISIAPAVSQDGAAVTSLERKPLVIETVLVDQGRANSVIVAPDAAEYQKLAEKIRSAVREASGAESPIRRDSEIASPRGEIRGPDPDRSVILLGNQETSGLVTHLCARGYCSVDTQFPGEGGYVMRTIHDPWGTGANVILLAGSDLKGVSRAVDRFRAILPKGPTIRIPRMFEAAFSSEVLKAMPQLTVDPSDSDIAKQLKDVETAFRAGAQGGVFNPIVSAGVSYMQSGREGYAKLFRALVFLADDLRKDGQGTYGGPWGAAADFLSGPLITCWDNVEESPSLSDEDRRRIAGIVLDYMHYWDQFGYVRGIEKPALRTNHWTFDGQGWLAAGQYFGKYYQTPDAKRWLQFADWCFQTQMKSFKPQEDCSGYQWITTRHMCRYATTRPDFSWFDSGKARIAGDLAIMCTDNLGYHTSFGDVGGFSPSSEMAVLTHLANVLRDGRYVWAIEKSRKARSLTGLSGLTCRTKPYEPTDLLGVKCLPTDPLFYDCWNGKGKVPQDRTFEKITFRASFDPGKPYLLLDGISGCYHGHRDGNSILRFTDRGRIWLADSDYIKSLPKYHNSMLILRDGQTSGLPIFCEKDISADLGRVGLTSTTTHDYAGTDWRRNVIWDKDRTFVIMDEVQAQATGDYSVRCHWQTLGVPELQGSLFRVTQKGPSFSIRNLDGARLRHFADPVIGQNWKGYKYAEPVVHTLQQIRTQKLRAGDRVCIINVLTTEAAGESPITAERVSDSSVLVGSGDARALVGISSGVDEIAPGIKTDARVYTVSEERIALGQATYLTLHGQPILTSDTPIAVELQAGAEAIVVLEKGAHITVPGGPQSLKLDGSPVQAVTNGRLSSFEVPAGRHEITGPALPRTFDFQLPKPMPIPAGTHEIAVSGSSALVQTAKYGPRDCRVTALAADETGIYVGRSDGVVCALGSDAKPKWSFNAGSEVRAVWVGRLRKDEPSRIAVGTMKGDVQVLDQSGAEIWKQAIPYFHQDPPIVYFTSADLTGDGNRALIVGAENWKHYAFDSNGKKLWEYESIHASTAGAGVDLNGDGRDEVIAGTEYYLWHAINPDGTPRWQFKPDGPRVNSVAAGDVTGSGKPAVIFGGADSNVYAVDSSGKRIWTFSLGDEVTEVGLADLNGDGVRDIVAGSLSFDVVALRGDGTRLWRRDLGEPILSLAVADPNGDGAPEICAGTEDGHIVALDRSGKVIASWTAPGSVRKLILVPGDPMRLAALCGDGTLVLLRLE